jgi:glycosyltransferase involved in cell wall biosynthesis
MNLLIYTQKVDRYDTVLGFFHDWIIKLSKNFNTITVICLEKGSVELPNNVNVLSLGKESGVSKIKYIVNFYKNLVTLRGKYDVVFVHMNQEYVLLGGLYWKIIGVPVYLWRNHKQGNFITRLAILLSNKVFYTSSKSYTARFNNAIQMPVGVNEELFKENLSVIRKKYSICMVGRVSPVKHVDLALEAINILIKDGVQVSFSIIGDVPKRDSEYFDSLKNYIDKNNLNKVVNFQKGVPSESLPELYGGFEICLNLTDEGSFDKTIVEATMCGTLPLVSSQSFSGILPKVCITDTKAENISESIKKLLEPEAQIRAKKDLENFAISQSLSELVSKLKKEIK